MPRLYGQTSSRRTLLSGAATWLPPFNEIIREKMGLRGKGAGPGKIVVLDRLSALVDVVAYLGNDGLFLLGKLALDAAQVRLRALQELFGVGLVVGNIAARWAR